MKNPGRIVAFGAVLTLLALAETAPAQIAGGAVYGRQESNPADVLRQQRTLLDNEVPPTLNSVFLDASVLLNIHADAYVAVFGISEEGADVKEARARAGAKRASFKRDLKALGIQDSSVDTDFIAQNRIYGFQLNDRVANEKLVGFEYKENVSVRCRSRAQVDTLISTAAKNGIFDLIKVDYLVTDTASARARLLAEAAKVIRQKRADYARLFGLKLGASPQLYADRFNVFYPTEMYANYQAAEGDSLEPGYNVRDYIVKNARKVRTFYYKPLSAKSFDRVVNPIVLDPVVQCTLYVKFRFESGSDRRMTTPSKSP